MGPLQTLGRYQFTTIIKGSSRWTRIALKVPLNRLKAKSKKSPERLLATASWKVRARPTKFPEKSKTPLAASRILCGVSSLILDHPLVEFIGEIGDGEKNEFLGGALALLFPIDWPEPFGLVMIEAMATGTPVIAWRQGSVPEVITDGVRALSCPRCKKLLRRSSRCVAWSVRKNSFEARFTVARMAADYRQAFEVLLSRGGHRSRLPHIASPVLQPTLRQRDETFGALANT